MVCHHIVCHNGFDWTCEDNSETLTFIPVDILTHFHRKTRSRSMVDETLAGGILALAGVRFTIPVLTGLVAFFGVVGSFAILIR